MPDPLGASDTEPCIAADPQRHIYADVAPCTPEDDFCEVLPFLTRLLLVSLGARATFNLVDAFRRTVPPGAAAGNEAGRFIDYVRSRQLPVPHIASVLDFEDALHGMDGRFAERIVRFNCEPSALFNALLEWAVPGALPIERFDMIVSSGGVWITKAAV